MEGERNEEGDEKQGGIVTSNGSPGAVAMITSRRKRTCDAGVPAAAAGLAAVASGATAAICRRHLVLREGETYVDAIGATAQRF